MNAREAAENVDNDYERAQGEDQGSVEDAEAQALRDEERDEVLSHHM